MLMVFASYGKVFIYMYHVTFSSLIFFFVIGAFEVMSLDADEDEHSIEMQLPYIAKVDRQTS